MAGSGDAAEQLHGFDSLHEFAARVDALFASASHEDFGAHQWLEAFRQTEHAWAVCSTALVGSCREPQDSAVALLAAQLLHAKVVSAWFELGDENRAAVVEHVLAALTSTPEGRMNRAVHKATARLCACIAVRETARQQHIFEQLFNNMNSPVQLCTAVRVLGELPLEASQLVQQLQQVPAAAETLFHSIQPLNQVLLSILCSLAGEFLQAPNARSPAAAMLVDVFEALQQWTECTCGGMGKMDRLYSTSSWLDLAQVYAQGHAFDALASLLVYFRSSVDEGDPLCTALLEFVAELLSYGSPQEQNCVQADASAQAQAGAIAVQVLRLIVLLHETIQHSQLFPSLATVLELLQQQDTDLPAAVVQQCISPLEPEAYDFVDEVARSAEALGAAWRHVGERHAHVFGGGQFYEQVRQHAIHQFQLDQQLSDATTFLVVSLVTVTMCKKRSTVTELLEFWGYARSYLPDEVLTAVQPLLLRIFHAQCEVHPAVASAYLDYQATAWQQEGQALAGDSATEAYLAELHELRIRVRDCLEDMIRLWPEGRTLSVRMDRNIQAALGGSAPTIAGIQALEAWIALYKGLCRGLEEIYLADDDDDDDDDDAGNEVAVETTVAKFSSARTRGLLPASSVAHPSSRPLDDILSSCLTTLVQAMEHSRQGLEQAAASAAPVHGELVDMLIAASAELLSLITEARWLVLKIHDVTLIYPVLQFILTTTNFEKCLLLSFQALSVVVRSCQKLLKHDHAVASSIFHEVSGRVMSDNLWSWLSTSPTYSESACECLGRLTLVIDSTERAPAIQQLFQRFTEGPEQQPLVSVSRLKGFATGLKDDNRTLSLLASLAVPALYSMLNQGAQDVKDDNIDTLVKVVDGLLVLLQNTEWEHDLATAVSVVQSTAAALADCANGVQHHNLHACELTAIVLKLVGTVLRRTVPLAPPDLQAKAALEASQTLLLPAIGQILQHTLSQDAAHPHSEETIKNCVQALGFVASDRLDLILACHLNEVTPLLELTLLNLARIATMEQHDAGVSKALSRYWLAVVAGAMAQHLEPTAQARIVEALCVALRNILFPIVQSQASIHSRLLANMIHPMLHPQKNMPPEMRGVFAECIQSALLECSHVPTEAVLQIVECWLARSNATKFRTAVQTSLMVLQGTANLDALSVLRA